MASKLRFVANISTMYGNQSLSDRFHAAAKDGFKAVEAQFLYEYEKEEILEAKKASGVELVMMNSPFKGRIDVPFGGETFGVACVPGHEGEFAVTLRQATKYADTLNCRKVHLIAGLIPPGFKYQDLKPIFINNLRSGVEFVEEYNITSLIEPMCPSTKESYFLNSFDEAVDIIKQVGNDNLKLLLDFYHLKMLGIEPEDGIEKYLPYTGHIQVSQAPNRTEVFSEGSINYDAVFKLLVAKNYQGHIGLEYTPSGITEDFKWIEKYGQF